jgi:hypothetical protein
MRRRRFGSAARKQIIMFLADKASDVGTGIRCSKGTIQRHTELGESTVQRMISDFLKESTLVETGPRPLLKPPINSAPRPQRCALCAPSHTAEHAKLKPTCRSTSAVARKQDAWRKLATTLAGLARADAMQNRQASLLTTGHHLHWRDHHFRYLAYLMPECTPANFKIHI